MSGKKTNTFSIYLLKKSFNEKNALKVNHNLTLAHKASNLPATAMLYIANNDPKDPWWKEYWGIQENVEQCLQSALVFIPVKNRCFVATFGHAYHKLKPESLEYNFGLIASLNALDPEKIKSADVASPENAMQHRTQSPAMENWTYFDVVQDDTIVKKLQGHALDQYQDLFKNVSGSDSFRFGSKCLPQDLKDLCEKLLTLFSSTSFKKSFPNILNVLPVKDPTILEKLDEKLIETFQKSDINLTFTIPEIIGINVHKYQYRGKGTSNIHEDVYIDDYREYLTDKDINLVDISIEDLNKHKIQLLDAENDIKQSYSIYRCILFDCALNQKHYHLFDGNWFEIEKDYLSKLKNELDPVFESNSKLIPCYVKNEDEYNLNTAQNSGYICLDKKNISTSGTHKIEPCDLIGFEQDKVNLIHIKISTRSSSLSHLFKQGVNSLSILKSEPISRNKLEQLVASDSDLVKGIDDGQYHVTYGIITAKKSNMKSDALPIFSRISLMAAIRQLKLSGTKCSVVLINDKFDRKK